MISIIIPCFNEENTIALILEKVLKANTLGLAKQVIVLNDGSTDSSLEKMQKFSSEIEIVNFSKNHGKGHAIRKGIELSRGDYVLIQDADLEYDPDDYVFLLEKILSEKASVVYGARQRDHLSLKSKLGPFYIGGALLTKLANFLYGSNLTDLHTCYKLFKTETLKKASLSSDRFEICHEITAYFLINKIQILEVPIKYHPRTFAEGKKISYRDGVSGFITLMRVKFMDQAAKFHKFILTLL